MTYQNIFRTLTVVVAAMALSTSCTFEQDEYFSESASLRITHQNEQIKNQLVAESAEGKNGWVIQYFVAGTDDYNFEGFNLFGKFLDNGSVTLASDHRYLRNGNANKYTEYTSTYDMLSEEGTVLSFNTWNDILTVFVDPVDPSKAPGQIINNGEGMYGDHNLVLKMKGDNELQFYGERHMAVTRMIPCDRPWKDYIADTKAMKNRIASTGLNSYYVVNGTDTMYFKDVNKGLFTYCERLADPLKKLTLKCVFTPKGFRIEHSYPLGDSTFQEFVVDNDTTCLLNEDGKVKVIACWDNYILNRTAIWTMDPNSYSAEQNALLQQIDQEIQKFNKNWSLASVGMGKTNNKDAVNGLVLTFYTNANKKSTNNAGLAMTTSRPAYGQMTITVSPDDAVDGNMKNVESRGATNMTSLARQFAATLAGTYNMTPDNYFLPTGAEFTSTEGGTSFSLKKE